MLQRQLGARVFDGEEAAVEQSMLVRCTGDVVVFVMKGPRGPRYEMVAPLQL